MVQQGKGWKGIVLRMLNLRLFGRIPAGAYSYTYCWLVLLDMAFMCQLPSLNLSQKN